MHSSLKEIHSQLNSIKSNLKDSQDSQIKLLFQNLLKALIDYFLKGTFVEISTEELTTDIKELQNILSSLEDHLLSKAKSSIKPERFIEKDLNDCQEIVNISFASALYFNSLSLGKQSVSDILDRIDKETSSNIRTNNLQEILKEVLKLTYYDFLFAEDIHPEHLVKRLCRIINLFKRGSSDKEFQKPILEKATFLLSKVLLSYNESERDKLPIMLEGENEIKTCKELIDDVQRSEQSKNLEDLMILYEKEKLDQKNIRDLQDLKQKFSESYFLQAYIDVKICKDSKKLDFSKPDSVLDSINQIQEIHDSLEISQNNMSEFDKLSLNINKIFILNNLISLADEFLKHINKNNLSLEDEVANVYKLVEDAMSLIKETESSMENVSKNYFTYYKYSKFLCNYYKYQVRNKKTKNLNIEDIENHIKTASNLLYKLEKFQRYRLSHQGSFIEDNEDKVFVYSSINLLFDYWDQRSLVEIQNIKANTIETHKEMQDFTQKSKEDIQKDMKKTKEETQKESQKEVNRMTQNVVGMLGVFSALIAFAFGSIQLFQHLTDFSQAIVLMSLFGLTGLPQKKFTLSYPDYID